jgi:hypothetical protein
MLEWRLRNQIGRSLEQKKNFTAAAAYVSIRHEPLDPLSASAPRPLPRRRRALRRGISVRPPVQPLFRNDSRREVHEKRARLDELRELRRKKAGFSVPCAQAPAGLSSL